MVWCFVLFNKKKNVRKKDLQYALQSPNLKQIICKPAPKSRSKSYDSQSAPKFRSESNDLLYAKFWSKSNDSRIRSKVPIWIKWFAIRKVWSKSNDSRTHSKVPIWIKWFTNPLQSPDLNQMICYMRSSDLNQMIHESAPKFQSESNDSRYAKSDLNQMIHEPTPKFRSESNDSQIRSKVLIWIKWFAIRDPIGALPNSESFCATMVQLIRSVKNLCFTNHYVL